MKNNKIDFAGYAAIRKMFGDVNTETGVVSNLSRAQPRPSCLLLAHSSGCCHMAGEPFCDVLESPHVEYCKMQEHQEVLERSTDYIILY